MSYKFNPLVSLGLDQIASYDALNLLGTVANQAALPGGATTGDVYQAEDDGIFYVWDGAAWDSIGTLAGPAGPTGATGATGADGADGVGVPTGGSTGQALVKASATDYDTQWSDVTAVAALDDLTDVTIATPSDGQVLEYDAVAGAWVNAAPSGGGGTPGGANTQVQFNDGGAFGGDAGLTYNKTTDELTVAGDINLDDGGTFSTTVQSVTPTANRTISFPDATGTVALVSGSNGTIQYNDAGTLKGNSDFTVDPDWNDASTVFTGLKLNVTNTASLNGSSLIDLSINGASRFKHGYDYVSNANTVTLDSANLIHINSNGGTIVSFYGANNTQQPLIVRTAAGIGLGPNGAQTFLRSDQAHALALRSSTSPQTFRIYNTVSQNNLDFERTSITRDSSGLVIDAQKGGTGVDPTNLLDLQLDGTSTFKFDGANRRFYLGSNDYAYMDVSSDGYILSLKNRYGLGFLFKEDIVINSNTRGILLGNQTSAPGIRQGTFTSPPTQVKFLNAANPTSTMWLFGKYGGNYPAAGNFHNGTGVSVWCGYGAQPTDANANGGNAGNFDVWLNAGGAGAGTGVAGANGRLRVLNDDTDTEVFGVEQSGVVQIGGERLIANLPSSPAAGMITRVTDGDSGLTFGNTVVNTGAGATPYLCWYNGTNWTVIGA